MFLGAYILSEAILDWWNFYQNNNDNNTNTNDKKDDNHDNDDNDGDMNKYNEDMVIRCEKTFNQLYKELKVGGINNLKNLAKYLPDYTVSDGLKNYAASK